MPDVFSSPDDLRRACDLARAAGKRVGFAPTMGALHEGHLTLAREARRHADFVVASVFVNPTQFGPADDLARYPRDLERDVASLASVGVDAVFAPSAEAMYPPGGETRVHVGALAAPLCGAFRPGHFEGVATVVAKLFALVGPSIAVFGRKDYQQLQVIRRLVADLFFPISIIAVPTVREADGLAMSSRNAFLTPVERARAVALLSGLREAARLFASGERRAGVLEAAARAPVDAAADAIDYVTVANPDTLAPFAGDDRAPDRALVAMAARIGSTRLIDNTVLGEDVLPAGNLS